MFSMHGMAKLLLDGTYHPVALVYILDGIAIMLIGPFPCTTPYALDVHINSCFYTHPFLVSLIKLFPEIGRAHV